MMVELNDVERRRIAFFEERQSGLTYRQIGEKFSVHKHRAAQLCKEGEHLFSLMRRAEEERKKSWQERRVADSLLPRQLIENFPGMTLGELDAIDNATLARIPNVGKIAIRKIREYVDREAGRQVLRASAHKVVNIQVGEYLYCVSVGSRDGINKSYNGVIIDQLGSNRNGQWKKQVMVLPASEVRRFAKALEDAVSAVEEGSQPRPIAID